MIGKKQPYEGLVIRMAFDRFSQTEYHGPIAQLVRAPAF